MVDVQLLQDTIKKSGMTTTAICRKSGIVRQTLYNRYNEPQYFTLDEVDALKKVLHLSARECIRIFFTSRAENNSAKEG